MLFCTILQCYTDRFITLGRGQNKKEKCVPRLQCYLIDYSIVWTQILIYHVIFKYNLENCKIIWNQINVFPVSHLESTSRNQLAQSKKMTHDFLTGCPESILHEHCAAEKALQEILHWEKKGSWNCENCVLFAKGTVFSSLYMVPQKKGNWFPKRCLKLFKKKLKMVPLIL